VGWIKRSSAGSWKASYRDPSRRIRSKSFKRKEDARRFLHSVEADMTRGFYNDPALGRTTLGEFWPRFLGLISSPTGIDIRAVLDVGPPLLVASPGAPTTRHP
jgi:hypothetical protein